MRLPERSKCRGTGRQAAYNFLRGSSRWGPGGGALQGPMRPPKQVLALQQWMLQCLRAYQVIALVLHKLAVSCNPASKTFCLGPCKAPKTTKRGPCKAPKSTNRYQLRPKDHLCFHIAQLMQQFLVNARHSHTFLDEDNMGVLKKVAVASFRVTLCGPFWVPSKRCFGASNHALGPTKNRWPLQSTLPSSACL